MRAKALLVLVIAISITVTTAPKKKGKKKSPSLSEYLPKQETKECKKAESKTKKSEYTCKPSDKPQRHLHPRDWNTGTQKPAAFETEQMWIPHESGHFTRYPKEHLEPEEEEHLDDMRDEDVYPWLTSEFGSLDPFASASGSGHSSRYPTEQPEEEQVREVEGTYAERFSQSGIPLTSEDEQEWQTVHTRRRKSQKPFTTGPAETPSYRQPRSFSNRPVEPPIDRGTISVSKRPAIDYIDTDIPERNALLYEPQYPPILNIGDWQPVKHPDEAKTYFIFDFYARDPTNTDLPVHIYRLPYRYAKGGIVDLEVRTEKIGLSNKERKYVVLFEGTRNETKLIAKLDGVKGHTLFNILLPYRHPETSKVYRVKTWVVYPHREDDAAQERYGYYTVPDDMYIPLNAYKPFTFRKQEGTIPSLDREFSRKLATLVVTWIPMQCLHDVSRERWVRQSVCSESKWGIHGFWPEGVQPQITDNIFIEQFKVDKKFFNIPGLDEHWPSVSVRGNDTLWAHQWLKHGRYMGFKDPKEYLSTAIKLFTRADTRAILETLQQYVNDTEEHNVDEFKDEIEASIGKKVNIVCVGLSWIYSVVREIDICFRREGSSWVIGNCDDRDDHHCDASIPIKFPTSFKMYSFMVLTVTWLPTQSARLQRMKDSKHRRMNVSQRISSTWKIHSFCPSTDYYSLLDRYSFALNYLTNNATQWKEKFVNSLPPDLHTEWPSLNEYSESPDLWFYWYKRCGVQMRSMDIPSVRGALKFFEKSVQLKRKLRTDLWTNELQFDKLINTDLIKNNIKSVIRADVGLMCYWSAAGKPYLVKVRLCYVESNGDLQLIDCPASHIYYTRYKKSLNGYSLGYDEKTKCDSSTIIPRTLT